MSKVSVNNNSKISSKPGQFKIIFKLLKEGIGNTLKICNFIRHNIFLKIKTFARQLTMFLLRHCKSVAPQRHCERTTLFRHCERTLPSRHCEPDNNQAKQSPQNS